MSAVAEVKTLEENAEEGVNDGPLVESIKEEP